MALAFRRWGPPLISVLFALGLQLSNAVQEKVGWVLIGLAFVLAGVYVYIERQTEGNEAMTNSGDENTNTGGDQNINYGHQHVGINKGVVTFRETPPTVRLEDAFRQENAPVGSKFLTSFAMELQGRPPVLGVAVKGERIEGVRIRQEGASSALFNIFEGTTTTGAHFYQCGNPSPGIYIAEVESSQPATALEVHAFIEPIPT